MYEIMYMDSAKNNLKLIKNYLDGVDRRLTNNILREISERILSLKDMPFRYPKYLDNPNYRWTGVKNYMIFYKVTDETKTIEIHRILHGARNISIT